MSPSGETATLAPPAVTAGPDDFVLPNGMVVAHQRAYETTYLYDEIFARNCYLQHGITLPPGAVVLDIGANIGMFSMFVARQCPDATIHAVEPAPALIGVLRTNLARHAPGGVAHHCGVSAQDGSMQFTYYPNSSVFSGFHADTAIDRAVLRKVIENAAEESGETEPVPDFLLDDLLQNRLHAERHEIATRSVSSLIAECGLERVDLLKIDAERSELAALDGITDADWSKIRQVALESHGGAAEHDLLAEILRRRGFDVVVDTYGPLRDTGFANIFARRAD
ncbi:FkbM family methyltransferase [Dactylosporangium aurantiacum]|uniref:FkbM family methyltransferase n=1 Tax=Dactylosporangium aurantiacum TaxID=35754 RepID=A0A9Q9MKZ4_9ACTN|nr:FkbM family methyltransferase [Dactylosporangium aurantiacum]MDG6109119.1 FkbM family methyltransferase [Dactylosporangium aurantiacum]UWZ58450.1 FkbM family methyltransferase [Dactylosporangium aurantiacum]